MSAFDVNDYWLKRGRTYMEERRTPAKFHRLQEEFLLDVLQRTQRPIRHILEIGCGFGRITKLLAQQWPQARIVALDLSPEQLDNARTYCGGDRNVTFDCFDFYSGQPLPRGPFDLAVAIEVFLHHPPEVVIGLLRQLAEVAVYVVNVDWSEVWTGPLPAHVWVHDYEKLCTAAGLQAVSFVLPEKVDGKQQKLFLSGRQLPQEVRQLAQLIAEGALPANSKAATEDGWTEQLRLSIADFKGIVPASARVILVDDAQWGGVRELSEYRLIPFLEKEGLYGGPPGDDAEAVAELERLEEEGANYLVVSSTSFWWLSHYRHFFDHVEKNARRIFENERLRVYRLKD